MTWSNYKHVNTTKILLGIMPSGAFTFVSKVYTGGISDLAIVERSGFIEKKYSPETTSWQIGVSIYVTFSLKKGYTKYSCV